MVANLHAVGPNERAPRKPATRRAAVKKPLTLAQAVEQGDYLEILRAQRRDIVASLPVEKGPAKAALHRQLSQVSAEIEAIESKAKETGDHGGDETADGAFDPEAV